MIKSLKVGDGALIAMDEIINCSKASFAAIESLQTRNWIKLN
jgi:hypothetical protein